MAFPTVRASAEAASLSIQLPAGIQAGDVLLNIIELNGATPAAFDQVSAGTWTQLDEVTGTAGRSHAYSAYWKVADGTEGGVTLNHGGSGNCAQVVYAIQDTAGEIANGTPDEQPLNSTTKNFPAVVAPWGTEDNLFIIGCGVDQGQVTVNAWPTGYDTNRHNPAAGGGGTAGSSLATATRELTANSDNPTDIELSTATAVITNTYVVRPTAAAPEPIIEDINTDDTVLDRSIDNAINGSNLGNMSAAVLIDENANELATTNLRPAASQALFDVDINTMIAGNLKFGTSSQLRAEFGAGAFRGLQFGEGFDA